MHITCCSLGKNVLWNASYVCWDFLVTQICAFQELDDVIFFVNNFPFCHHRKLRNQLWQMLPILRFLQTWHWCLPTSKVGSQQLNLSWFWADTKCKIYSEYVHKSIASLSSPLYFEAVTNLTYCHEDLLNMLHIIIIIIHCTDSFFVTQKTANSWCEPAPFNLICHSSTMSMVCGSSS